MPPPNEYFQVPDRQRKLEYEDRRWQRRFWRGFAAFLLAAFATMTWIVIEYSPSQATSLTN